MGVWLSGKYINPEYLFQNMYKKRGEKSEGFFAKNRFWVAVATLIGTIVGAGVLGIPYVIAKSGFVYGSILIFVIGIAFVIFNLLMGEVVLRTKGQFQLTGYMERYLGKWGKRVMAFSMMFAIYGALTAYIMGEGEILKAIFGEPTFLSSIFSWLPGILLTFLQNNFYALLFFIVASFIVYKGVKAAGQVELVIISLLILVVLLIGVLSFKHINLSNFNTFNPAYFYLPYGVILFSFIGAAAIPEMQEELGKNELKKMKKALIIGSVVPLVLYFLFSVIVIGLVGLNNFELLDANQRIATIALSMYSNPILGLLANIFAVFSMFTTFLTLGVALKEVYHYDYKINPHLAFILTVMVPLFLALAQIASFITALAITGSIAGGLEGILVVLAYWKAKKKGNRKPEYTINIPKSIGMILIVLLGLGIAYQLWQQFF